MTILTPRPYQQKGIEFLRSKKRAILADAPGLGKTLQASLAAVKPVVVICPTYLVEQWAAFLTEQFPDDAVSVARGDIIKRGAALKSGADWIIGNVEMLRTYYFPEVQTVIFDEMHYLRKHGSQQANGAFQLAKRTERVYGLTATPIYKDASDLWHLLHMLDPKTWSSYWKFIGEYCNVVDTQFGTKVVGTKNRFWLEVKTKPYIFGRTYKEVGMHLPDLVEKHNVLRFNEATQKKYDKLKNEYVIDDIPLFSAGEVLHRLRMFTATEEKIQAVKSIIDDSPRSSSSGPPVVFCWYKDTADRLARELNGELITGDVDPTKRAAQARTTTKPVIVATLASLAEGVDLSASRTIIFFEEDYTPGRMYQALSRVRRHSENKAPVIAHWVRYAKTVDDAVHKAVIQRIGNAHAVLREALK